jgi:hypothetical protein
MTVPRAAVARNTLEVLLDVLIEFLVFAISTTLTTIFTFIAL